MARIRSTKPEFWTSEQVMSMSRDARLLFLGMWNFCDDNGIHPASPLTLKAEVLPADPLTADQVIAFVDEMIEQELVEEYEVDGRMFWRVTGWHRHQRIDQPTFRHPTGDTHGDTGDTKGDRVTCVTYKRLSGKQRQIVLRKLRERDGDTCHRCGDPSNLTILSLALGGEESSSNINELRLICPSCKRAEKRGDTRKSSCHRRVTQGDTVGDSTTERSGEDRSGEERRGELTPTTPDGVVVASDADAPSLAAPKKPDCPHQQIIELYHEVLPMCPRVRDWTPARQVQLRARWNEDPQRQNLDYWQRFFEFIRTSCPFLIGQKHSPNKQPFFADLEWMTKQANFTKVRESKYAEQA